MSEAEDVIYSPLRDDLVDEITRLRARETALVDALTELTADCPDCGGTGTVYMLMDETEVGMAPGSSGRDCKRCHKARKALPTLDEG